jgi:toxin ParE1/3/4
LRLLRDACLDVAEGRRKGRIVPFREEYLKLSAGSHLIFYRENEDQIIVMRIFPGICKFR